MQQLQNRCQKFQSTLPVRGATFLKKKTLGWYM